MRKIIGTTLRKSTDRILFDTNVLLDALLNRTPYARNATDLIAFAELRLFVGLIAPTSVTTCYYFVRKKYPPDVALSAVRRLCTVFEIAPIQKAVLEKALDLRFTDFEDAVIHETARNASADAIVTRDLSGFTEATIQIVSPTELLSSLNR